MHHRPRAGQHVSGIGRIAEGSRGRSTGMVGGVDWALGAVCVLLAGCSDGETAARAPLSPGGDTAFGLNSSRATAAQPSSPLLAGSGTMLAGWPGHGSVPRRAVSGGSEAPALGRESGADDIDTELAGSEAASSALFPYFEKVDGSLDYMGVKVVATTPPQRVWAPGTSTQEFPGGWVTPGDYVVRINTPRVHHKDDGTLTGTLRDSSAGFSPEHQLMTVVVNQALRWEGWENHGLSDPPEFIPVEWGSSHTVSLSAGDVLHVAYGNEIVPFQKREGSDGIVVYCVEHRPKYRGGLWGIGHIRWSTEKWNTLRNRTIEAAGIFNPLTDSFHYGPADGTLPAVLPSDYQMSSGSSDNEQSNVLSLWILHRAMGYLQDGASWSGSLADLDRLFQFYCNNIQTAFCFSDRGAQHNHYAHGPNRYPPYQIRDFQRVLVGAVALGYDPNYEPLYRLLMHLAQRTDMTLTASGSYTYDNNFVDGGLSAHRDDNEYTQWLWYRMGATDMGAKGSHNINVWGPCFWARELFLLPHSSASESMLWSTGPRFGGSNCGHGWTEDGIGPGYSTGYGSFEVQGAMWLWFTDTYPDSQLSRWARRDFLYTTNVGGSSTPKTHYGAWVQATFVAEPVDLQAVEQGGDALLTWSAVAHPHLSHYNVYCRDGERDPLKFVGTALTNTFLHEDPADKNAYYQVCAVDADGHEGSLSDQVIFRP